MSAHDYLLFVGASLVLVLIPGPDMAYILGRAVAQGRGAGLLAALGVNAGAYVHLIATVTGLSAVLMASATAFSIMKWIGAAYLAWIGVRAIASASRATAVAEPELRGRSARAIFWQGFLSDALNPKVAIFYLAFLPQFVAPSAGHPLRQLLALGLTVNMVALPVNVLLVLAAARLTRALRGERRLAAWGQRILGATFIGLGARLALERR